MMLGLLKTGVAFIPGVGPLVSGALGMFGGGSSTAAPNPNAWKTWAVLAGAIFVVFLGWRALSYVHQAQADHLAVATLTDQLSTAKAAAASNAAALADELAQSDAVADAARAATAAAAARSDTLATTLEALRHAPKSVCVPSPAARAALGRLRQ